MWSLYHGSDKGKEEVAVRTSIKSSILLFGPAPGTELEVDFGS